MRASEDMNLPIVVSSVAVIIVVPVVVAVGVVVVISEGRMAS